MKKQENQFFILFSTFFFYSELSTITNKQSSRSPLKNLRRKARPTPAPGLGVRVVDDLEAGPYQLLLKVDRRAADEVEGDRVDREQRALLLFFDFIASPFLVVGAESPVADARPGVVEGEDVGEARAAPGLDREAQDGASVFFFSSSSSSFFASSFLLLALVQEEAHALGGGRGEAQALSLLRRRWWCRSRCRCVRVLVPLWFERRRRRRRRGQRNRMRRRQTRVRDRSPRQARRR